LVAGGSAKRRLGGLFARTLHRLRDSGFGCQGGERGPQGRVRCQHPVVAMPMLARRRDQRGDALDELQGREVELGTSVGTRLWQVVDQPVPIQLLDPLRGERRSGTITQQPLEPAPVMRFDARGCIQGESAAVLPLFPVPAILLVQYPAPHEGPQDAAADLGLYRLGILRIQLLDREEAYLVLRIGLEHAVDDAAMEVSMQVERGAETVNEGHRAGACIRPRTWAMRTQVALDLVEEDTQGSIEGFALMVKVIAQPLWKRQDLPWRSGSRGRT